MRRKIGALIMMVIIISILCISGCLLPDEGEYLPEFENEIYRYAVKTDDNGDKKCYIVGLTELGLEQAEIILPQEIDGIPVRGIGYERRSNPIWYFETVGCLASENLIKLYVPYDIEQALWEYCSTNCRDCRPVVWKALNFETFTYRGRIIGYNLLSEYLESIAPNIGPQGILANVSYMYNYDNAEDDGYYWVDSYDNGLIMFIPPVPERDGYTFDGWYKEPECINIWNFDSDKTGNVIELRSDKFDSYDVNDIIFLFAKWINN